jgi:predicted Ser/Thr protein kinase
LTPERWQKVTELFDAALARDAEERPAFLARQCGDDEALRDEVASLLDSHARDSSFMEQPAVEANAVELLADVDEVIEAGSGIGRYEIVSRLASGGMGEVYLARDQSLGRKVALKLLPRYLNTDKDRLRRFELEARAASALSHPNVCTVIEVGKAENGRHFIAMEYVEGMTLRRLLDARKLSLFESLDIAVQIASALATAHESGIVHRDIKPENIVVRPDGYVKVLDFGLAKLSERAETDADAHAPKLNQTGPGVIMGTARYMSPEQARGLDVDMRTDIWSLGVVLYEMLTGEAPFDGETTTDVILAVVAQEPPPLALRAPRSPPRLQRIVNKALAKDKADRYQETKFLLTDLRRARDEIGLTPALLLRAARELRGRKAMAVRRALRQASAISGLSLRRMIMILVMAIVLVLAVAALGAFFYVRYLAPRGSPT